MKTTAPFLSLEAHGSLGQTLVARRSKGRTVISKHPTVAWKTSPARTAYAQALNTLSALWHKSPMWKALLPTWTGYPSFCHAQPSPWSNLVRACWRPGNPKTRPFIITDLYEMDAFYAEATMPTTFLIPSLDSSCALFYRAQGTTQWNREPLGGQDYDTIYFLAMVPSGVPYECFIVVGSTPISPFKTIECS
jgi:hypothetical protein